MNLCEWIDCIDKLSIVLLLLLTATGIGVLRELDGFFPVEDDCVRRKHVIIDDQDDDTHCREDKILNYWNDDDHYH